MTTPSKVTHSPSNARSRSILSRIAAPFASKPRSLSDYSIQPDDPHRRYAPGDFVRGKIQLTVLRPTRVMHIVLSLHGFIKVYKNPTAPGEGIPSEVTIPSPGKGRRGTEYHGNGLISLFEDEVVVCGEGRLGAGRYSFAFEAQFPPLEYLAVST